MKTVKVNIYEFSELSEDTKEKVLNNLMDINVDYDWWQFTYEDASMIGLKINGFDLERNRHITGELTSTGIECADKIIENHGEMCGTYKRAKEFLHDYDQMFKEYEDSNNPGHVNEDSEYDFDNDLDELEKDFERDLLEEYCVVLQNEADYLMSQEAIIETIESNDYMFTENGDIF